MINTCARVLGVAKPISQKGCKRIFRPTTTTATTTTTTNSSLRSFTQFTQLLHKDQQQHQPHHHHHHHHAGCNHHHHHDETCGGHDHHHHEHNDIHDDLPDVNTRILNQQHKPLGASEVPPADVPMFGADTIDISTISKKEIDHNFQIVREMIESTTEHSELYMLGLKFKNEDHMNLFYTLHALNMELAQIKTKTRGNPTAGALRVNWWKMNLESAIKGYPAKVPVLICISSLAQQYPNAIATHRFRNWMKWRQTDLKWKQVPTLELLENYAHNLYSSLFYIMLHAFEHSTTQTDHAASHLGKAFGLTQFLRGTPYHAEFSETYLPAELCAKFGVSESDIYSRVNSPELENVVFEIADLAKGHLESARSFANDPNAPFPKEVYPIFLSGVVCDVYLKQLEKVNFNVFDPSLQPQRLRMSMSWQLLKTGWFGKF